MSRDEEQDLDSVERSMGRIAAASERIATTLEALADILNNQQNPGLGKVLAIRFGIPQ